MQDRLDPNRILRAAADQNLAPGRKCLHVRIGEQVEGFWLYQVNRVDNLRRGKQVVDDFDQPVVEVGVRVTEIS